MSPQREQPSTPQGRSANSDDLVSRGIQELNTKASIPVHIDPLLPISQPFQVCTFLDTNGCVTAHLKITELCARQIGRGSDKALLSQIKLNAKTQRLYPPCTRLFDPDQVKIPLAHRPSVTLPTALKESIDSSLAGLPCEDCAPAFSQGFGTRINLIRKLLTSYAQHHIWLRFDTPATQFDSATLRCAHEESMGTLGMLRVKTLTNAWSNHLETATTSAQCRMLVRDLVRYLDEYCSINGYAMTEHNQRLHYLASSFGLLAEIDAFNAQARLNADTDELSDVRTEYRLQWVRSTEEGAQVRIKISAPCPLPSSSDYCIRKVKIVLPPDIEERLLSSSNYQVIRTTLAPIQAKLSALFRL